MVASLFEHIQSKADISKNDFAAIEAVLEKKLVKRKQVFLHEGEVCKQVFFVTSGCIRLYSMDDAANEHVLQLAMPSHWVADLFSFLNQSPSKLYMDAIEDTELLVLSHEKMDGLYAQVPALERYFRILFQNAYLHTQQRLNCTISTNAKERYLTLLQEQPDMLQKVPLVHIASYLGITPESLSRIRKQLADKQH